MKENEEIKSNSDWPYLVSIFRERARKHERSAHYDMLIIVITMFSCTAIFAGADRLADWMFKTTVERQADIELANAKAEIYRAVAALGEPASQVIRDLPSELMPIVRQWLAEKKASVENNNIASPVKPKYQTVTPSLKPWDMQASQEPVNAPKQSGSNIESRKILSPPKNEVIDLYNSLMALYEKNADLHKTLIEERERLNEAENRFYIEMRKADSQIDIATIHANTEREIADKNAEIAQSKSDNDVEIARSEVEIAQEITNRAEDFNGLISSSLTRVGAIVLVIWLIKIFVRKRQRSVELSAFYLAIADALEISNGDLMCFKDILPNLSPPETSDFSDLEMPIEKVARLFGDLTKRSN